MWEVFICLSIAWFVCIFSPKTVSAKTWNLNVQCTWQVNLNLNSCVHPFVLVVYCSRNLLWYVIEFICSSFLWYSFLNFFTVEFGFLNTKPSIKNLWLNNYECYCYCRYWLTSCCQHHLLHFLVMMYGLFGLEGVSSPNWSMLQPPCLPSLHYSWP
jgi:hypothetical protein